MGKSGMRGGETLLEVDPGGQGDASVAFIGVVRSDWQKGDCPRNIRQSRERGGGNARIELKPGYGAALAGLKVGQALWVLTWMDRSRRDLALQSPAHADGPRGTFSLRSPARPNPVAMSAVPMPLNGGRIRSGAGGFGMATSIALKSASVASKLRL